MSNAKLGLAVLAVGTVALARPVLAAEIPIGEPIEQNGMEIAAVYLQPVEMEPKLPMNGMPDVHLEADIHAIKGNNNGFGGGEWIPYLTIAYTLTKAGSDWSRTGSFMAMVAADGPHYGANIRLDGPGKYHVTYDISPPPLQGFFRHTDKETGVGAWWAPFDVQWDFTYVGTGKKGGY